MKFIIGNLLSNLLNIKTGESKLPEEAFENLMISIEGLEFTEQQEQIERFVTEIIPVLKREIPNSIWEVKQTTLV